jgi:hypothetical protein
VWARVDKIDRIRPQPGGGAIVLVEDERTAVAMARVPSLSTLIATARILDARRVLDLRYHGTGEIRYAAAASSLPTFLVDAINRAGAHVADATGDRIRYPAAPASVSSTVDLAFAELAHHVRTSIGQVTMSVALRTTEERRRRAPLDMEERPALYWPAVFELTALAGELSRPRGGRWIDVPEMPVPFAIRLASGELAKPSKLAQRIIAGQEAEESLATDTPAE